MLLPPQMQVVLSEVRRLLLVRAKERFSRRILSWPYGGVTAEVGDDVVTLRFEGSQLVVRGDSRGEFSRGESWGRGALRGLGKREKNTKVCVRGLLPTCLPCLALPCPVPLLLSHILSACRSVVTLWVAGLSVCR